MPGPVAVNVTVKGPLFSKKIDAVVKAAMYTQCIKRIGEEQTRKYNRLRGRSTGKWRSGRPKYPAVKAAPMKFLGAGLEGTLQTHTASVRTSGGKWTEKNIAAIKAMAPRLLRKAAQRIVGELT